VAWNIKAIRGIAALSGFPDSALNEAAAVAIAESDGVASVVNPTSHNTGLWQIGPKGTINDAGVGLSESQLKDPGTNARAAYKIWKRDGGTFAKSWSSYGNAKYTAALAKAKGTKGGNPSQDSPIGQAVNATIPGTEGLATIADAVAKGGNWVSNPASWLRVAYVTGGAILAIMALQSLFKPVTSAVAGAALKTAAVLPQGKAVKGISKVAKVIK
jgi:hypothetical protein